MAHVTDLDLFLKDFRNLDEGSLIALSVDPTAEELDALETARALAHQVARRDRRGPELERLRTELMNAGNVGGAGAGIYPVSALSLVSEDLRQRAMPAIMDAATAIILGDALQWETSRTLRRRWDSVVP